MVETVPYLVDCTSGIGQGAPRQKPVAKVQRSKPDDMGCAVEEVKRERSATPYKHEGPLLGNVINPADYSRSTSTSPSPPPPVRIQNGKILYTEEDRTWFFRYVRLKLERNPGMTHGKLMKEVTRKVRLLYLSTPTCFPPHRRLFSCHRLLRYLTGPTSLSQQLGYCVAQEMGR